MLLATLGFVIAVSRLKTAKLRRLGEMKLKTVFSIAAVLISFVIVGMIFSYVKETLQDMIRFTESTKFYSSTQFFAYNCKLHDHTAQRRTTQKPFIYLTETDYCLPRNLASSSEIGDTETSNCDVIVLSFRAKCQENN